MKTYKIRKFQNGRNKNGDPFLNFSLTIPSAIAESLPSDMQFACELTEDGILFRPATPEAEAVELPTWAQRQAEAANGNGSHGEAETEAKPKRQRRRPSAKTEAEAK